VLAELLDQYRIRFPDSNVMVVEQPTTGGCPVSLVWIRFPIELNNVANGQFPASSGFHLTVDQNFATLDQQLRLSARACNAAEFQELIQPQSLTFGKRICGHGLTARMVYSALFQTGSRLQVLVEEFPHGIHRLLLVLSSKAVPLPLEHH